MTIQDLKDNKQEIIEKLTALFGSKNLISAMNMLKDAAEEPFNNTSIDEAVLNIENGDYFGEPQKMRLADYIAGLTNNDSRTYALNHKK